MGLLESQKNEIEFLLCKKLDDKLKKYNRESVSMPFLTRLMQDHEKVAAYSFIHSLATTLGMSIYEGVARIVSQPHCKECFTSYDIGGVISKEQASTIGTIIRELRNRERETNIQKETREVLKANPSGGRPQKDGRIADFYMLKDGVEQYFEIKTVKPNIDVFTKSKTKMLEWIARRRKNIRVFLVFPYNPYYPQTYERFTLQGLLKPNEDLLIGSDFWDYLGGKNTLDELLVLFDAVGKKYKEKIADKIKQVAESKMKV